MNGADPRRVEAALFSLHIFTATGAALAFLALVAAAAGDWPEMFLWLGIALFVDAADGPIARRTNIAEKLPRWSGEILDLVVDFVTYVFVPAYAISSSGLVPEGVGLVAGVAIVVTSALYFADRGMKLEDNYFQGFPAIWNVVAFYLILLQPPAAVTALFVGALCVLTFVPFPYIHPIRVKRFRAVNLTLLALGCVLSAVAIGYDMNPPDWIVFVLSVLGLYILGGGLLRGNLAVRRAEAEAEAEAAAAEAAP